MALQSSSFALEAYPHIKAVLFDKDGTLIKFHETWVPIIRRLASDFLGLVDGKAMGLDEPNTQEPQDSRLRALFEAVGYEAEQDLLLPGGILAAGTETEILDSWFSLFPDVDKEGFRAHSQTVTQTAIPVAVEGLQAHLKQLRARGLRLGIATNDSQAAAQANMQALNLSNEFYVFIGADTGFGAKPDGGMLLGFCQRLGLKPEQVAMVGDNWQDMAMAKADGAGLKVGVLSGASSRADLESSADVVLGSLVAL